MTRLDLLRLLVGRARKNGFEFRRWYTAKLGVPWIALEAALTLLDGQRRYYALIFSHEFAQTFWKPGSDISFDVPARTFQRVMPDGSVRTVQTRPFIRRTVRPRAWQYHLRQMAMAEEPLRYLRRYLHIEEDLEKEPDLKRKRSPRKKAEADGAGERAKGKLPRPLPTGLPAFLQHPYRPATRPLR